MARRRRRTGTVRSIRRTVRTMERRGDGIPKMLVTAMYDTAGWTPGSDASKNKFVSAAYVSLTGSDARYTRVDYFWRRITLDVAVWRKDTDIYPGLPLAFGCLDMHGVNVSNSSSQQIDMLGAMPLGPERAWGRDYYVCPPITSSNDIYTYRFQAVSRRRGHLTDGVTSQAANASQWGIFLTADTNLIGSRGVNVGVVGRVEMVIDASQSELLSSGSSEGTGLIVTGSGGAQGSWNVAEGRFF